MGPKTSSKSYPLPRENGRFSAKRPKKAPRQPKTAPGHAGRPQDGPRRPKCQKPYETWALLGPERAEKCQFRRNARTPSPIAIR